MNTKKKFLLILILCSGIITIRSSSVLAAKHAYIFYDNVLVRKSPEISASNIIDKLNLGTEITIIDNSTNSTVLNGLNCNWIRINYKSNSLLKEGFVWGGLISLVDEKVDDKILLLGIKEYIKEYGYKGEIKIIKNNSTISKIEFKLTLDRPIFQSNRIPAVINFKAFNNLGLNNFNKIFKVSFIPSGDGIISNCAIIGYINNNLYFIAEERYWG